MANRAYVVNDIVVIRPKCIGEVHRRYPRAEARVPYVIRDHISGKGNRKVFALEHAGRHVAFAWPSEVRLASGAAERADVRAEKMEREIEAMKAERNAQRMKRAGKARR